MKRALVFPAAVAEAAGRMGEGAYRTDEMLEGLFWMLERGAEAGHRIWMDPPLYRLRAEAGPWGATVSVLYAFDPERVVVLALAEGNGESGAQTPIPPIPPRDRGDGRDWT